MHGRASEVVETLGCRRIDICRVQESRWKGCSARLVLTINSYGVEKTQALELLVFCLMKTGLIK